MDRTWAALSPRSGREGPHSPAGGTATAGIIPTLQMQQAGLPGDPTDFPRILHTWGGGALPRAPGPVSAPESWRPAFWEHRLPRKSCLKRHKHRPCPPSSGHSEKPQGTQDRDRRPSGGGWQGAGPTRRALKRTATTIRRRGSERAGLSAGSKAGKRMSRVPVGKLLGGKSEGAGGTPRTWKLGRPLSCPAGTLAAQTRPGTSQQHKALVEAGLEFRRRKEREKKTG